MPVGDYDRTKTADVSTASGNPTVDKAQPVIVSDGDDSTTGTGDAIIDFSGISDAQDIAVYDTNDNLLDYEIESLDTTAGTGVLWVYGSWTRDDTTQIKLAYGNNAANTDRQNQTGTWTNTGQNTVTAHHFNNNPITGFNSVNQSTGTVTGTSSTSGQLDGAGDFDGSDDNIRATVQPGAGSQTAVCLINLDSNQSAFDSDFIATFDSNFNSGFSLGTRDDKFTFTIVGANRVNSITSVSTGNWVHLVGTYRDGTTQTELWRDSSSQGTNTKSGTISPSNNVTFSQDFSGRQFDGKLDAARVFDKAVNQDWVQADYDAIPVGGQTFFSWNAASGGTGGTTFIETTTESASVSDDTLVTAGLSVDESVSTSDSTTSTASFTRSFTNTVNASDTFSVSRVLTALANETVSVSDSSSVTVSYTRDTSEVASVNDSFSNTVDYTRTITETSSTTDNITRDVSYTRDINETATSSDTYIQNRTVTFSTSEQVSVTDTDTFTVTFAETVLESVTVADDETRDTNYTRTITETTTTGDSLSRDASFTRTFQNTVNTNDVFTRDISFIRQTNESVTTSDSVNAKLLEQLSLWGAQGIILTEDL